MNLVSLTSASIEVKYFSLKESLNVKKVYKLIDGENKKIDLITGLYSGGYTEIINGDLQEGDEVLVKVIGIEKGKIRLSRKQALEERKAQQAKNKAEKEAAAAEDAPAEVPVEATEEAPATEAQA